MVAESRLLVKTFRYLHPASNLIFMRITRLTLVNFKRFSRLSLEDIPADAKLVLLIGANGSGKSSVFDAFQAMTNARRQIGGSKGRVEEGYYRKNKSQPFEIYVEDENGKTSSIVDAVSQFDLGSRQLYGRTSLRHVPQLLRKSLGFDPDIVKMDDDRPLVFIERDLRFENDIEFIIQAVLRDVFSSGPEVSSETIKSRYIQPINQSFERIFGTENGTKLRLLEIIPPLEGNIAQINFEKGNSIIHYNYLSSGEKEIFSILLNLLVRKDFFNNGICFFDELDLHLNTAIQSRFLAEITEKWIPENCQIWTASHSLGFIDYARKSDHAVILDFDDLDFDYSQTITPEPKDRMEVYDIAIPRDMLFEILQGKNLVVCENQNDEYYNLLRLPDTIFIGLKDARDVFLHVKRDDRYLSVRDRDFLSDSEIQRIRRKYPNHRILQYYDFENYLYHPDNIAELNPAGFDKDVYIQEILRQKNEKVDYILPTLISSRQGYEEFKTDNELKDKDTNSIVDDFKSNEFERFYKYFDMKDKFSKHILHPFNLNKQDLVKTNWFKGKIAELLR